MKNSIMNKGYILMAFLCFILYAYRVNASGYLSNHDASSGEAYFLDKELNNLKDTIILKGKVLDEEGHPLPGAVIRVKGAGNGAIANEKGEFILITPKAASDSIIISHLGYYTSELKLKGQRNVIISLRQNIQELRVITVSTGYQTIPKERVTGSFDFIDQRTLNEQVGRSILNRLENVASGVFFPKNQLINNAPEFMIRGLSTINGPKEPLIVVDNFPYDGDINNINPNDVESITILKDAAAASIWGTKAGNGVVVITTKKGSFNQPLKVAFNMNYSTTDKPDLSSVHTISSNDYIDVEQMLFNQGYYDSYLSNNWNFPAVSPVVDILNNERAGTISATEAAGQIAGYRKISLNEQYEKYIYQNPVSQQYSVNLTGGGRNMAYYLSAGYDKSIDQLSAENDRFTIHSSNTYIPVKNLRLSVDFQYTKSDNVSGKSPYGSILINHQWRIPYLPLADQHGNPLPVATVYRAGYTDTAGDGQLLNWKYYPLEDWKHDMTKGCSEDLTANLGLDYTIMNGLHLQVKYLYERQNTSSNNLEDLQSFATRDLINTFSQINSNTGTVTYVVPLGGILNFSDGVLESQDIRGQIGYNHTWEDGEINAIAGTEVRQLRNNGSADVAYGYNSDILSSANADFINPYPTFINGSYNYIQGGPSFSGTLNRYVSFYGNAAYSYQGKYTFSVSGRRDASNSFGVSTNRKWNPLWSAGMSWDISKESFYHLDWMPYLKLRATYGFSGNTDPYRSGITTMLSAGNASLTNYPATRVDQIGNPDLRWEKVRTINVGFDFGILQFLSGNLDFYLKHGTDLFGPVPYDPTDGLNLLGTITKNVASMKGRGIDLKINTRNIDKAINWKSTLLFSYSSDKTAKYYNDTTSVTSNFINDGTGIGPMVGKPLYPVVAYPYAGLDDHGNPQGYLNKKISTDYYNMINNSNWSDLIYKPALPVFYGSFINYITWKGFSLVVNISYRLDYYFLKPSVSYTSLFHGGAFPGSADYAKRWQKPGDEKTTNVPFLQYPADGNRDLFYNYSSALLENAGNIKLQYINLSYDFNVLKWQNAGIRDMQVYFNASNLGMIWCANKDHIDPDYVGIPTTGKTYTVGLHLNF